MAIKDMFKISRKTFFNPRAWFGFDSLKDSTHGFVGIMRGVFGQRVPFAPKEKETFNEAAARFQLTEKDIADLQFTYFAYAMLFVLMAIGILIYGIWIITHFNIHGFIISLALVALLLSQAFRYHFFYFQIKHRKLGCTFAEWRSGKTNEGGAGQ